MDIVLVSLVLLAIAWFEGTPLLRFGHRREATIFFVMWGVSLVYSLSVAIGWKVPNPMDLIDRVFGIFTPLR